MNIPDEVRTRLREKLWGEADRIGWVHVSRTVKSQWYDNWARDPEIGGVLERYMDRSDTRIYLKDTFLKRYAAARKAAPDRPLRILNISRDIDVMETYEKPHGRRLADGRIIVWGRAHEWKSLLMALHERAFLHAGSRPYGVVFEGATALRFADRTNRDMIEDAARKLGIETVAWVDL